MHRQLSITFGPSWYDNPRCILDLGAKRRLDDAKSDGLRRRYPIDPPHVVASLAFGFWVSLLGRGGSVGGAGTPRANYEMTLWRPALHRAFPHVRKLRAKVHRPLDDLRTFRNRIAHHEPIFNRPLVADYEKSLQVQPLAALSLNSGPPLSKRWGPPHPFRGANQTAVPQTGGLNTRAQRVLGYLHLFPVN